MKGLLGIAAALIAFGSVAEAAERLTGDGAELPAQVFAEGGALEVAIDASGDEVLSVHTMIRPHSTNLQLMRDRDGYWTEWDGNRDNLAESAARQEGDVLVYKIFHIPPRGVNGMTVTVAYRTPNGLKYGMFAAGKAAEGTN